MLHWVEDVLVSNRASLSLQSRQEIVLASQNDLPGRIQSEGLLMEGHLCHLRQWLTEEITFAVVASDAKHGYKAVNAIEKEAHPVSEAHKVIINRAKAEVAAEASKKEKFTSSSSSTYTPRGGRGRGGRGSAPRGRGYHPYNRYNNDNYNGAPRNNNYNNSNSNSNSNKPTIHCVLCGKSGHLANFCYSRNKNDPKGPSGNAGGIGAG